MFKYLEAVTMAGDVIDKAYAPRLVLDASLYRYVVENHETMGFRFTTSEDVITTPFSLANLKKVLKTNNANDTLIALSSLENNGFRTAERGPDYDWFLEELTGSKDQTLMQSSETRVILS